MNVLSLFDGMSGTQIALKKLGIKVDNYYSSEIDKYAIKVTNEPENFPDTIQLGDVKLVKEKLKGIHIDLLVMGSPCQDLSFAGKGKGLIEGKRSSLFFAFVALLWTIKPKYFLVENVRMKKEYQDIISDILGVQPIKINSSLVSAQNRVRLYWTNIPNIKQPRDRGIVLSDILEEAVDSKYDAGKHLLEGYRGGDQLNPNYKSQANTIHRDKVATLSAGTHGYANGYVSGGAIRGRYKKDHSGETEQRLEIRGDGKTNSLTTVQKDNVVVGEGRTYRKLTPIECERLQTVPDNYTAHVSNTQRYKMLGNGFTVEVIKHILGNMER